MLVHVKYMGGDVPRPVDHRQDCAAMGGMQCKGLNCNTSAPRALPVAL